MKSERSTTIIADMEWEPVPGPRPPSDSSLYRSEDGLWSSVVHDRDVATPGRGARNSPSKLLPIVLSTFPSSRSAEGRGRCFGALQGSYLLGVFVDSGTQCGLRVSCQGVAEFSLVAGRRPPMAGHRRAIVVQICLLFRGLLVMQLLDTVTTPNVYSPGEKRAMAPSPLLQALKQRSAVPRHASE